MKKQERKCWSKRKPRYWDVYMMPHLSFDQMITKWYKILERDKQNEKIS